MSKERHSIQQIVRKLREAEASLADSMKLPDVCGKLGVSEECYYRWRKSYEGLRVDQVNPSEEAEEEIAHLERFVGDATAVLARPGIDCEKRAGAMLDRGKAYAQLEELEEAIADFGAVIDMVGATQQQKAYAHRHRGVIHAHKDDLTEAIADFTSVIETPDAPGATVVSALLNRAFLHVRREQWEQAVEDSIAVYYSAAALSEDRCHAALVASSIMVAVTGTRDEAIEMLTWVIQNAASNSRLQGDALATRAVLHAEAEHGQEADHDIDRLMQLAEEDPHFGEYMSSMFGDEDGVSP